MPLRTKKICRAIRPKGKIPIPAPIQQIEDFNDKEYIFGGTALERDKGSELTVTYELTVDSGTARLYWLDKGEEKMIADTSKNGTYSVTLDEGDNYLTLEGNDFCGSLQVVVE